MTSASRGLSRGEQIVVAICLALALGSLWTLVQQRRHGAQLSGAAAPTFSLPLLGGGQTQLAELRGKPVVLAFFASWCHPCRREMPGLADLAHRFKPQGVHFLAVDIDAPGPGRQAAVQAFVRATGVDFPVGLDDGTVADHYGVQTIPHLVILDGKGKIRDVIDGLQEEEDVAHVIESATR